MYNTWLALAVIAIVAIFHEQIGEWLRKLFFSSRHPRVYICVVNGIAGVVKANDYNRASRKFWREFRRGSRIPRSYWFSSSSPRFHVGPIFLFSYPKGAECEGDRILGDWWKLEKFLAGCEVEIRDFFIPNHDTFKSFCREDKKMDFNEAYRYIHYGFWYPRPGLIVSPNGNEFALMSPLVSGNPHSFYERG